jgi:hypothetical protein
MKTQTIADVKVREVMSTPAITISENSCIAMVATIMKQRGIGAVIVVNTENKPLGIITEKDLVVRVLSKMADSTFASRVPDIAAVNTVCILDSISQVDINEENPDRSNLKWAKQMGYERTIFPLDYGLIDILSIRQDEEGLFLHSALDVHPREPIVNLPGNYILNYKVFSQNFPVLQFSVEVDFHYSLHVPNWVNSTAVKAIPIVQL